MTPVIFSHVIISSHVSHVSQFQSFWVIILSRASSFWVMSSVIFSLVTSLKLTESTWLNLSFWIMSQLDSDWIKLRHDSKRRLDTLTSLKMSDQKCDMTQDDWLKLWHDSRWLIETVTLPTMTNGNCDIAWEDWLKLWHDSRWLIETVTSQTQIDELKL